MSAAENLCQVVSGKYALERVIGSGAAATVYEAENLLVGKRVALKRLSESLARSPELSAVFLAEARVAARVGHPNIADILDLGLDRDGRPYIVMELLEGETLQQILARRGPLPVPYACELMLQVLAAVDAAHAAGIVHRDLKPANVMVTHPRPHEPRVKVLDFGIAQGLVDVEEQRVASVRWVGTPLYMAPEQGLGCEVDARADVYSASVMMYELLSGELPYQADSVETLLVEALSGHVVPLDERNPAVPSALARLIESGLIGRRDKRLGSVRELADGLCAHVAADRRASFRANVAYSGSPIPLVERKNAPAIPGAPATPRFRVERQDAPPEPAPRPKRWTAVAALAVGFLVGLGASFAAGLWP